MRWIMTTIGVCAFAAGAVVPAAAQQAAASPYAVTFNVNAGGLSPVTNLNEAGTTDFKTGFNVGGGVSVDVWRYLAIRGDFTWGRNQIRANDVETGVDYNKFFYGAALQLQYPTASGWMPYIFGGGGGITLDPHNDASTVSHTKGAGMFGVGVNYTIPNSSWQLFGQGTGWVYNLNDMGGALTGLDKTQLDLFYNLGVAYRLPF